jgi:HAD superfamily hydrolase (TIGR01549 family)
MQTKLPIAVTFDCWQTLLIETDSTRPMQARADALIDCASSAQRPLTEEGAQKVLARTWRRHEQVWQKVQIAGAPEMARWSLEALGISDPDIDPRVAPLSEAFANASLLGEFAAIEGAKETLMQLREENVRLGLVCDTGFSPGRVVRQLLERVELLEPLEALAFSDEVRVPKPHPRIFERALDALGVAPGHALHIGDLRRTDVAGAKALGMRTVRLSQPNDDRSRYPEADHVVDSHAQFREWLGLDPIA